MSERILLIVVVMYIDLQDPVVVGFPMVVREVPPPTVEYTIIVAAIVVVHVGLATWVVLDAGERIAVVVLVDVVDAKERIVVVVTFVVVVDVKVVSCGCADDEVICLGNRIS